MTAADFWLAFIVAALTAYCIVRYAAWHSFNKQRQPVCRTANASAMDQQVQQLQALVPSPRTAAKPPTAAAITASLREARQKQADRVKREAVQAALLDLGKRDKTSNPYPPRCRANEIWALHYDHISADAAAANAAAARHRTRSKA